MTRMTALQSPEHQPPEADVQFDINANDESFAQMARLFARHGDIYRVYAPGRKSHTYVINHPDDIKRVLVGNHRNYTKGVGLDRVKILLGNGIMTSEGDFWRRQRYMMQPMFHRRVVTEFAQLVSAANGRLIDKWAGQSARGELINLTDDMSELTLEVVLQSIFGSDLPQLRQPFEVVTREPARDLKFAYQFRSLTRLVAQLIARRRSGKEEHFDFLGMLMDARDKESGDPMTEKALIDEVMTLVVAGHETTASGLNWIWYLLARHPEVDARLAAEINAAPEYTAPSLAQMETLGCTCNVVNEALRLYPPGWLLSRRTIAADTLSGYPIPAGSDVFLSPYFLHRHPRYWKDPDAFQPERFDAEHEAERPRFAYMPFAAGPRHCIGESLALYEMYVHLYKVARHYRLALADHEPIELEAQINLRTKKPLFMRLERR